MYRRNEEKLEEETSQGNCFICNIPHATVTSKDWKSILLDTTKCSNSPICSKIGDIIGDAFKILVTREDRVCIKCENIINEYDQLIMKVNKIKKAFMELLYKKYNFQCEEENFVDENDLEEQFSPIDTNNCEISSTEFKIEDEANLSNNYELLGSDISEDEILQESMDTDDRIQTIFKCSRCEFVTNIEQNIKNHIAFHPDTSVLCVICEKAFKTRESLQEHLKEHDDVTCPGCTMLFPKAYMLRSHILTVHSNFFRTGDDINQDQQLHKRTISLDGISCIQDVENGSEEDVSVGCDFVEEESVIFKCKYCKEKVNSKEELVKHEAAHARFKKGTEWSCPMCPKKCYTRSGVQNHLAKHTGDFKYYCEVCKKGFMSPAAVKEHMGVHTKELRYTCDICGQQFTFDATLRVHRKWHDDPKPYPCKFCGKKFSHTSIRKHHIRKEHTGERPHACEICDKTFFRANALKKHMASHTKIYTFNCKMPNCNTGFMSKHKYGIHLSRVHGDDSIKNEKKVCEYKMKIRPNALLEQATQGDHSYETYLDPLIEYIGEVENSEIIENDYELQLAYDDSSDLMAILDG